MCDGTGPEARPAKLRRFWIACALAALILLASFGVFEATGASRAFALPEPGSSGAGVAGAIGFALLVGDVFLPVPSSVVMIGHGALFGWLPGALLSTAGATGATLFGWSVGRLGRGAFRRWISPEEHERAADLLRRHGMLAIVATRPIPIVAETVALVAGASGVGFASAALSGVLGSLPGAVLYAWAGSRGLATASDVVIFALVMGTAALSFWIGERQSAARGSK